MTVREYIGARYVPLFMGQWDITVDYEALCVVQYQGDSYTSRQPVPAGTDIFNEEYWLESGNYNAQVEAYRQEVFLFDDRIGNLEETVGDENSGLVKEVNDLETNVQEGFDLVENEINRVEDEINVKSAFSTYVAPSVIGDVAINRKHENRPQCSCVCVDDNGLLYVFEPNNYDGLGDVEIFTPDGTFLRKISNAPLGHANSCAYVEDTDKVVLCMLNTYDEGVSSNTTDWVEFTPNSGTYNVVDVGKVFYGISYDHVTKKFYGLEISGTATSGKIFEIDPTDYSYTDVHHFSIANNITYNQTSIPLQDFAVYNNVFYILVTDGSCYYDRLTFDVTQNMLVKNSAYFVNETSTWYLGEPEGIEFAIDGSLIGSTNFNLNSICVGFVVEWNINGYRERDEYNLNPQLYGTVQLQNRTSLKPEAKYYFRSLEYLEITKLKGIGVVQILDASFTEPGTYFPLRLNGNYTVHIQEGKTYTFKQIAMYGGSLFIRNQGTLVSTDPDYVVHYSARACLISFDNRGTVTYNAPAFFGPGYSKSLLTIGLISGAEITVENAENIVSANEIWLGALKMVDA